jgi:hypothetical protein
MAVMQPYSIGRQGLSGCGHWQNPWWAPVNVVSLSRRASSLPAAARNNDGEIDRQAHPLLESVA